MTYQYLSQEDMTKENLIEDDKFIEDASLFLGDRAGFEFDYSDKDYKEQIYDAYMEHFRIQNVNEVTATKDLFYAQTANDEDKARMNRLMNTFDQMDGELGWDAVGDYAQGVFTAPSTYAGIFSFGAAKAGAVAANQGVKLGIREILKRSAMAKLKEKGTKLTAKNIAKETAKAGLGKKIVAGVKSGAKGFYHGGYKTALGSMAVDGGASALTVYQQERLRNEVGIKDGMSWKNIALSASFSALGSGTIGSVLGSNRTITSNVAEQIRNIAIKKETVEINNVHKTITAATFKGAKTSKNAKKVRKMLSLAETVPEKLAEGKTLYGKGFGTVGKKPNIEPTVDEKLLDNIASAASHILARVKPIAGKSGEVGKERISSQLARGLTQNDLGEEIIVDILNKHGLSVNQLTSLMVEELSRFGRGLGKLGRISQKQKAKQQADALKELTEIDQKLINLGDITSPVKKALVEGQKSQGSKIGKMMTEWFSLPALNKARIGFMTIQTATTARNTTNGYMRNYMYALDNIGTGLIRRGGGNVNKLRAMITNNKDLMEDATLAVNLGKAEMRSGGQGLYMKDLWLGAKSWETTALETLFRDKRFINSDLSKTLFREMGDVGEELSTEGGIVKIARMANMLNTMSDNMFKRAVFSREIDKYLFASGQKGGLRGFFEDSYLNPVQQGLAIGKFSQIDDRAIGTAMEKALEATYQLGEFNKKKGAFNSLANTFITGITKTIPFSAVIPFPRYLVNQFIFQWEHMPILGMVNLGGILNKKASKTFVKNKKTGKVKLVTDTGERGVDVPGFGFKLAVDSESMGKQLTGLATLAAFYGIRTQYGDETTGPYEFKFNGETYDLQAALGPFMGFAWVADLLYRNTGPNGGKILGLELPRIHTNDKVAQGIPTKTRDGLNALLGGSAKGGTGLWIVDTIVEDALNSKTVGGPSDMTIEEATYKFLGNLMNTATVGFGMLKDIAGTVLEPEYRVVIDKSPDVDKETGEIDMIAYMLKVAARSFPQKYDQDVDVPVFRPSRDKPLHNVNPFLKMLTGFTQVEKRTLIEDELARLRFDYREYAPKRIKGDSAYSNLAKGEMGIHMDGAISSYIISSDYENLPSDKEKRYKLAKLISHYRNKARKRVLTPTDADDEATFHRKLKAIFIDLPASKRNIIEEDYEKRFGKSIYKSNPTGFEGSKLEGDFEEGLQMYMIKFKNDLDDEFLPYGKIVENISARYN